MYKKSTVDYCSLSCLRRPVPAPPFDLLGYLILIYAKTPFLFPSLQVGAVVAAAVIANWAESVLGACGQGRWPWLNNDLVNMLQICLAAGIAMALNVYAL